MITLSATWIRWGFLVLGAVLLAVVALQIINSLRHGSRMPMNIFVTLVYLVGVIAIVLVANSLLSTVDWSATYTFALPNASLIRFGL